MPTIETHQLLSAAPGVIVEGDTMQRQSSPNAIEILGYAVHPAAALFQAPESLHPHAEIGKRG